MRLLLLACLLAACGKGGEPEKQVGPPAMSVSERQRGLTICKKYVERVCGCAEKQPDLKDACDLGKGQPEAIQLHIDVLEGAPLAKVSPTGEPVAGGKDRRGPLNDNERRFTEDSLRKVVAACVKLDAELDPTKCPRP